MRDGPRGIEDTERGLILAVGGDTLSGIALLMQGRDGERPLCLDLLWTMLQRGKELSKRDWRLERVAIVELRGMAYIGRLFFGDGAGGAAWDCDCRPSDGCWLSLKVGFEVEGLGERGGGMRGAHPRGSACPSRFLLVS